MVKASTRMRRAYNQGYNARANEEKIMLNNTKQAETPKFKLKRVRKGNDACRFFETNVHTGLIKEDYSFGTSIGRSGTDDKYGPAHKVRMIHDQIMQINLVTECSVREYEITVSIPEGFSEDEDEWARINWEDETIISTILFGSEPYEAKDVNFKERYSRSSRDDF